MFKKNLFTVLLICFFSAIGLSEIPRYVSGDDPPPDLDITIGNWNGFMDPHGCVLLDENQVLKIKMVFTVGISDVESCIPIFYNTHFYDGSQDVSQVQITNDDLTPVTFSNGFTVYTYIVDVFAMAFEDECAFDPSKLLDFEYSITLTDANGDPYPIELCPELLIPTPPADFPNGEELMKPIGPSTSYVGLKNICCYGSNTPQGLVGNTGSQAMDSNMDLDSDLNTMEDKALERKANIEASQTSIFPNPFDNYFTIKHQVEVASTTYVELWDSNGKLVSQFEFLTSPNEVQEIPVNTNQLANGVYYCRLRNTSETQTFRILKVGNH